MEWLDTYRTAMTGLDDQTQVRRERTTVGSTGSLFIRVRRRHVVRKFSGTLEHLALVVRTVLVLDFLRHGLGLISCMRDPDHITPSDTVK